MFLALYTLLKQQTASNSTDKAQSTVSETNLFPTFNNSKALAAFVLKVGATVDYTFQDLKDLPKVYVEQIVQLVYAHSVLENLYRVHYDSYVDIFQNYHKFCSNSKEELFFREFFDSSLSLVDICNAEIREEINEKFSHKPNCNIIQSIQHYLKANEKKANEKPSSPAQTKDFPSCGH